MQRNHKDNDIPDIVNRYSNSRQKATDYALKVLVPFADIKANDWDSSINKHETFVKEIHIFNLLLCHTAKLCRKKCWQN
jgi:hypothetical protein